MYASLRSDLLLGDIAGALGRQADIKVYEGRKPGTETLLFESEKTPAASTMAARFSDVRVLGIHGQEWTLRVSTLAAFDAASSRQLPWWLLLGGSLFSALIAAAVRALTSSRSRAIHLAERMTNNLRRSEAESRRLALVASHTTNAVILASADGKIEWVNEGFTRITGYTLPEVIGRKPGIFCRGREPTRR